MLIGGFASSLTNFRGPLLKELVKRFEVYAVAPFIDQDTKQKVEKIGAICVSNEFVRTGLNPVKDIAAFYKFRKQVKAIKPDFVLAYTIKPVVFGLKASKTDYTKRFALITGKGSGFEKDNIKGHIVSRIVKYLYAQALKSLDGVVFQNHSDKQFFQDERLIKTNVPSTVIEGTGVDMAYYKTSKQRSRTSTVTFLFIARLIKEKGIPQLVEAAKMLQDKGYDVKVQLLGWIDPNPGGISKHEIDELDASGIIQYLGTTSDVRPFIEDADVFVLPTYYNEGLPRTIQECMAMRMPIITTDHPGCSETVIEGENGCLVPIKDAHALMRAMEQFVLEPDLIEKMGQKSLELCKEKFDVNRINAQLLKFMSIDDL